MDNWSYVDACSECFSLNINVVEVQDIPKVLEEDEDRALIHVTCRDCGEQWDDEVIV